MSILEYFRANNLTYTTSSSSGSHGTAVNKGRYFYYDYSTPSFWQMSFDPIITIGSYTLRTRLLSSWFMIAWKISYSLDGSSFTDLQYDCVYNTTDNVLKFPLRTPIRCKTFKISGVKSSSNTDGMIFNNFDLFSKGSLSEIRNKCSCNFYFYKRRLTIGFLLTLFPSFLT